MSPKRSNLFIMSLLGGLSVVSPFSIDMYLPAFPVLAEEFGVPSTTIALTLSSYFIGLALGQVFYGPVLDRVGRKKPLAAGLGLYLLATIACTGVPDVNSLIALRFIQGFGGCVAQVASTAMVRDFFPVKESAKFLSLLFLFIAVSPLLAPTIGSLVIMSFGWKAAFYSLAVIVAVIAECYNYQLCTMPTWQAVKHFYDVRSVRGHLHAQAVLLPARARVMAAAVELLDLHVSHGHVGRSVADTWLRVLLGCLLFL